MVTNTTTKPTPAPLVYSVLASPPTSSSRLSKLPKTASPLRFTLLFNRQGEDSTAIVLHADNSPSQPFQKCLCLRTISTRNRLQPITKQTSHYMIQTPTKRNSYGGSRCIYIVACDTLINSSRRTTQAISRLENRCNFSIETIWLLGMQKKKKPEVVSRKWQNLAHYGKSSPVQSATQMVAYEW